jgi:spore germination protein KB
MIIPSVDNFKNIRKSVFYGFVIAGITLLVATIRNTGVLGNIVAIMSSPAFIATRQINLAQIVTRVESLIAIVLLITMFFKVTVLYYATVVGIAQIFNLRAYESLVIPVGIICINFSTFMWNSAMEQGLWGSKFGAIYATPFEIIIPLITLAVVKIRGLPKKVEDT